MMIKEFSIYFKRPLKNTTTHLIEKIIKQLNQIIKALEDIAPVAIRSHQNLKCHFTAIDTCSIFMVVFVKQIASLAYQNINSDSD